MKKSILSTVLLSTTLLLAACQDQATSSDDVADETDATTEDTTEQISEQEEAEATSEENEEATEDEETDEEEEVAFQYQINPNIFSVEPIDEEAASDEKLVLLTFDDAPYGNSLQIADALEERDMNAIFFVNSMYMEDEEGLETIQKVHEMGFEIANHTHTHAKLDDYSNESQYEEIIQTNDIIEDATGVRPRFFRAPHGIMTDYAEQVVAEENMSWVNWSFGYDWMPEYQEASALADITLNTNLLGNGTNILMHDRTWTAAATPAIVDGLIEKGFTIVDPKLITHQ